MKCAQCGAETPDEDWNCASCRMNVYWGSRHWPEFTLMKDRLRLPDAAETPAFLRQAHAEAMNERAGRGGLEEHRVRQIARRAMARQRGSAAASESQ